MTLEVDGIQYTPGDLVVYNYYGAKFLARIKFDIEDSFSTDLYGQDLVIIKPDSQDWTNNTLDTWELSGVVDAGLSYKPNVINYGKIKFETFKEKYPEYFI